MRKNTKLTQKSRGWEAIKIRVVINGIENRKTIEKINKSNSWVSGKIDKIHKPLAKTDQERERM